MARSATENGIVLTTVYFFRGQLPGTLALRDAALPLAGGRVEAFAALHGLRSRREGPMAARRFADREGLKYTVIDFLLATAEPVQHERIAVEGIASMEIVLIDELSRAALEAVYDLMERRAGPLQLDRGKRFRGAFNALVRTRPDLLCALFGEQEMAHVKALVYSGRVDFSDKPMTIALVAQRHWGAIAEAACRLDPSTLITLNYPQIHR